MANPPTRLPFDLGVVRFYSCPAYLGVGLGYLGVPIQPRLNGTLNVVNASSELPSSRMANPFQDFRGITRRMLVKIG